MAAPRTSERPATDVFDPTPMIEKFSEISRIGEVGAVFRAVADYQSVAMQIALHVPFLPLHVYAHATRQAAPLASVATSVENAMVHVADSLNQNTDVLRHEAAPTVVRMEDATPAARREALESSVSRLTPAGGAAAAPARKS